MAFSIYLKEAIWKNSLKNLINTLNPNPPYPKKKINKILKT